MIIDHRLDLGAPPLDIIFQQIVVGIFHQQRLDVLNRAPDLVGIGTISQLHEIRIPLGIKDDDDITAPDILRDEDFSKACLANPRCSQDQGVSNALARAHIDRLLFFTGWAGFLAYECHYEYANGVFRYNEIFKQMGQSMKISATMILTMMMSTAGLVLAKADGPDYYRVQGVAKNDVLNIRSEADPHAAKMGEIPAGAGYVKNPGCKGGLTFEEFTSLPESEQAAIKKERPRWCRVEHQGIKG